MSTAETTLGYARSTPLAPRLWAEAAALLDALSHPQRLAGRVEAMGKLLQQSQALRASHPDQALQVLRQAQRIAL
jgi:hypothetical protein